MRFWLLIVCALCMLASCVPNRKYQYLQKDDVNKKVVQLDTVIRTYDIPDFEYRVQPQDVLYIRFESLSEEEYNFFSQQQNTRINSGSGNISLFGDLVNENGEIQYPVVGKIKVSGLTIFEIQEKLKEIASQYLKNPAVKVRLVNFRFTVLGEVKVEGTVLSNNNRTSVLEAVGLAGGISDLADRSKVKLIRQEGSKMEVIYLNLLDENLVNSPYYFLHQSDILIVPPLKQRPFRTYFSQNLSIFISSLSLLLLVITLSK
jgi:polysaccharide export outer membrane protein